MTPKSSGTLDSILRTIRLGEDAGAVRSAIMDLGYSSAPAAYEVLVAQLDNLNPAIQHAAVVSLGRLGRPQAVDELVKPKIFRSTFGNIRWAAVAAVGRLGDYRVIDHLLKAVEDPEWIVRTQAVTEIMLKVQNVIDRRDSRLARVLVHMLSLEHEEIVALAVDGFGEFGQDSLPLLHDCLSSSSANIRRNAVRALGRLRSSRSIPEILPLLQDSDWKVRASAAETLGLIGDRLSLEALIQMIQDGVSMVQEAAATAIVRFGRPAVPALLNALTRERDKFALRHLLECLGRIGDPKSAPALIGSLRSSYFIVRQTAMAALARFGPSIVELLIPTLSFNRSDISAFAEDAGRKERPELQVRAIKALGGLEDHRAVALLKELVETGLPDIQDAATAALSQIGCASWGRCCAMRVLAEVGDAALAPRLIPSLADDSANVRFETVRALGRLGGAAAVRPLIRAALRDADSCVRAEGVRALRDVGAGAPKVLEAARRAIKDKSREVRAEAVRLLGLFRDPLNIPPLLKAISDPHWSVRENAEIALLNYGRQAGDSLLEKLGSSSWTTRFRAARLLGEIGDTRAIGALEALARRRSERVKVREVAARAARKLQGKVADVGPN